jgi:very-short-patch-repair endonuclease
VKTRSIGIEFQLVNGRARELRTNATAAERRLWHRLRDLKVSGQKFRRQVPIDHFIVDFACLSHRLIVEVDGATHATDAEIAGDLRRQRYLESQGFSVLRFSNMDVATNIDGVMESVVDALNTFVAEATPTPNPSPQGGGEPQPVHPK